MTMPMRAFIIRSEFYASSSLLAMLMRIVGFMGFRLKSIYNVCLCAVSFGGGAQRSRSGWLVSNNALRSRNLVGIQLCTTRVAVVVLLSLLLLRAYKTR